VLEAYILVNAEPGMIWEVAEAVSKIDGVKMAHAVTGQFDVAAFVVFAKVEELGRIIEKVQQIKGVRRTQTLIAVPQPVRK
jgi:DNA-binding Lrp family transcriptional regulator